MTGGNDSHTDGDNCLSVRKGPHSRPYTYMSEDIQERSRRPRSVQGHVQPPSAAGDAGEAMGVADLRTARPSPVRWTDSHAPSKRQEAAPEAAPKPPRPGSQTRGN
jgi:hypothetical protein